MQDFDEAIVLNREALSFCPQGHSDWSLSLTNLATRLSTRFKQLGAIQDLDEAIILARGALDPCPPARLRSIILNNLAIDLSSRYQHLGAMQGLDTIVLSRKHSTFARREILIGR